ncbi:MAG: hypothetical protein ABIO18_00030 [Croceibacterium sp.]
MTALLFAAPAAAQDNEKPAATQKTETEVQKPEAPAGEVQKPADVVAEAAEAAEVAAKPTSPDKPKPTESEVAKGEGTGPATGKPVSPDGEGAPSKPG